MHTFFVVLVIGTLAVISPGPDFLIVTRNSLLHGKRVGIATALGIATGNIWWIAASLLGISYAITKTASVFSTLKILGALYLAYLGLCALMSKKTAVVSNESSESQTIKKMTCWKAFRMGVFTNVLNPKCGIFFLSLFGAVIVPSMSPVIRWAYGFEVTVIAVCWFMFVARVLSVEKIKKWFVRFSVWFDRITGAVLLALGLKIALSRD